jgi:tetratricopeptide (TPR) repeat protein
MSPKYGVCISKAVSMNFTSIIQRTIQWLVVASFLSFGFAMAQSEPTINEVYATAQAGKVDQAQVMIQQVLTSHPKSAKAHFVQSELFARQGKLAQAREALTSAEKLAPGLPFAKAESVRALRSQLAGRNTAQVSRNVSPTHYSAPEAPSSSSSWGLPLLLAGGVMLAGYLIFRRRPPEQYAQQPAYANQGGLGGPQNFCMAGAGTAGGVMQPTYGQAGYGQPAGSGLGGRIMGGVATGLAVGAGVMAAEAIGRNLMGNHGQPAGQFDNSSNNNYQPLDRNTDMGGQNFGISDSNSWDDGGSIDVGGGGWDN